MHRMYLLYIAINIGTVFVVY